MSRRQHPISITKDIKGQGAIRAFFGINMSKK
jgi:hypothetical protein